MVVKFDKSSLLKTKWCEYALRFFFGGAVTAIAALIASKFGPVVGGLFLGFPAIFPASATLVAKHQRQKYNDEKGREQRGRDAAALEAAGAAMGSLGMLAFAALVWSVITQYPAWLILGGALLLWALSSAGIWSLWRKLRHPLPSRFTR